MKKILLFLAVGVVLAQIGRSESTPKEVLKNVQMSVGFDVSNNETIKLWPNGNPDGWLQERPESSTERGGVTRIVNVNTPMLTVFPPKGDSKQTAIVICPGGGYRQQAIDKEGYDIAEFLSQLGYHAFVLKYRLPKKGDKRYVPALQDAQRAISIVRSKAKELGYKKIGIMGFSAGGHLSATTSAHSDKKTYDAVDDVDKVSSAPDFVGLIYPAYLLKKKGSSELASEVAVKSTTPPTFLVQTSDDGIMVECALYYYLSMKKAGRNAELHIYNEGGHGYGLRKQDNSIGSWPILLANWLESLK